MANVTKWTTPPLSTQAETLQLLAAIVESSDDAIFSKTLDGSITTWNKAAERMYGYRAEEIIGKSVSLLQPSDRLGEVPDISERLKNGQKVDHFETMRVAKDGHLLTVSLTISPIRDAGGRVIGASTIAHDITELVEAREALKFEASHDSLLRIWNRGAIIDLLSTEFSRAKRFQTSLSVLFVDLDFFKEVNDSYGHLVGDDVLRSAAEKISSAVREYDHVGRYGGDEFLVVLPNGTAEAAWEVAERVRQQIGDKPIVNEVETTVSIGVSQWRCGQELSDLIRQADVALYRAKQNGRNRVEVESASETDDTPMGKRQEVGHSLTLPVTDGTFMSKRQEVRHSLVLPVRIWGMDANGQMFEQHATTVDVTTTGAHITGIKHLLQRGCVIGVEHRSSRARYRVTWVGSADDGKSGNVGVQLIETGKFIWGRVIPRVFGDSEDAEFPNEEASR
jgi:diguanylate cyclase (GGDEF)-like protein/PAS domain S-box-containing protein